MPDDGGPPAQQMAVVLTENAVDKLLPFATLVSGAVAMGMRVDVFASYWGLEAFRSKGGRVGEAVVSPGHGEAGARLEAALAAQNAPQWKAIL